VVLLWGLAGLCITLRGVLPLAKDRDGVSPHVNRFDGLRKLLPPGEPVGYLGDGEKNIQTVMAFIQTQYALAPVLVAQGTDHPRVVGNFLAKPPTPEEFTALRLTVEKDFGHGVILYRSDSP
jgi:hypothetical protein